MELALPPLMCSIPYFLHRIGDIKIIKLLEMTNMNNNSALPMMAMKEIPAPNSNAATITALVKTGGAVTGYQLSNGQVVSKEEGVALAKQGGIYGVGISERDGTEYLKSVPDGTESNNLNNLPSITATSMQ
jgi:hypothetical protein